MLSQDDREAGPQLQESGLSVGRFQERYGGDAREHRAVT